MLMGIYHFLPPILEPGARVLLLGTFPSPISREKGEYYANPRNQFWPIIFDIFDIPFSDDYRVKTEILTSNGIALWDVIASCGIEGALDANIRNPIYNTLIPEFVSRYGIREIIFSSGNAYTFYKRGIGDAPRNVLPSTSPANASMRREEKLRIWARALIGAP